MKVKKSLLYPKTKKKQTKTKKDTRKTYDTSLLFLVDLIKIDR